MEVTSHKTNKKITGEADLATLDLFYASSIDATLGYAQKHKLPVEKLGDTAVEKRISLCAALAAHHAHISVLEQQHRRRKSRYRSWKIDLYLHLLERYLDIDGLA